jgi:SNF2 family DNA or RNA helicase
MKTLQILTPFMLRRLKSDVDFVIPPKREVVVYAPLSIKQQEMYRCILDKTIAQLVGGPATNQVNDSSNKAFFNTAYLV